MMWHRPWASHKPDVVVDTYSPDVVVDTYSLGTQTVDRKIESSRSSSAT